MSLIHTNVSFSGLVKMVVARYTSSLQLGERDPSPYIISIIDRTAARSLAPPYSQRAVPTLLVLLFQAYIPVTPFYPERNLDNQSTLSDPKIIAGNQFMISRRDMNIYHADLVYKPVPRNS